MEAAAHLQWFQSVYCCCGVMPSIALDKLVKMVKKIQKIGTICERQHICSDVDIEMQINKMTKNRVCKAASQHSVPCKEYGRGQGASRRSETLGIHRVASKHY